MRGGNTGSRDPTQRHNGLRLRLTATPLASKVLPRNCTTQLQYALRDLTFEGPEPQMRAKNKITALHPKEPIGYRHKPQRRYVKCMEVTDL
jgi:hypothetical protein